MVIIKETLEMGSEVWYGLEIYTART